MKKVCSKPEVIFALLLGLLLMMNCCSSRDKKIRISADTNSPEVAFALEELNEALREKGLKVLKSNSSQADILFSIENVNGLLKAEGFSISKESGRMHVKGADPAGAMYGGLELAEQVRLYGPGGVKECLQNPYMELRGTKFNIPLDARNPSYTDVCDAAQKNIPEMWNMDFWKEYIDNLARYRYNYISIWNLHPFPSMVKVPGYEDVALEDVHRSTAVWKEFYSLGGLGFTDPEILADPEIVKKISMDEKIEFWREVMAYAKGRNVDFYIVTWNIFVGGAEGKYGITDDIANPVTRDYFRKSVKQMFVTYPDLAGIGLTTGENMPESGFEEKEEWAFETYALGVLDAAQEMPDRKFAFIHRQHMTGALDIAERFKPLIDHPNIEFLFSFKYAQAHVMSATTQPFHEQFVKDIQGMKTIWTLRNDDNYIYRWGAPDFVREFIHQIPHEVSRGFYYGSDQWVWGREFLMKDPELPRQIEIVKHWYHWMMWGRLGYNPEMDNDRFKAILQDHFPGSDGAKLFTAWQDASMIYPITTGFHWGALDFQWYIEGCKSTPGYAQNETGFHDVNRFINLPPHDRSGFQSIPGYVKMEQTGGVSDLATPFEVAGMLHDRADRALEALDSMNPGQQRELAVTLHDIRTMALLGKYYAHKIAGSTNLALYRESLNRKYRDEAVSELTLALDFWKQYTASSMEININPLWMNRVGNVDWEKLNQWVEDDIRIASEDTGKRE